MNGGARRSLPVLQAGGPAGTAEAGGLAGVLADAGIGSGARIAVITLGCDKNTVDSERILGSLAGAGAVLASTPEEADVLVVNTCGFIEMAKQESIDVLLEAARLKEAGRVRAVVGLGCLVQRYKTELVAEIPEIDLFLGLAETDRLVPELASRGFVDVTGPLMERPLRVLAAAAGPSSHLKISEGCDHGCAFCAIPLMRGKFRSTPIEVLVREAHELERRGAVELNIVSQDTTWYGRDWARLLARGQMPPVWEPDGESYFMGRPFAAMPNLSADPRREAFESREEGRVRQGPIRLAGVGRSGALPLLLRTLLERTTVPWYRLFYMYPSGITDELVELMAAEPRILPYLDMPIQHGSDPVLARMRRPERRATIRDRVRLLRSAIPDLTLRTTVIVGFPGETEDDFGALLDLLEELRFEHLGAFAYSEEEGTPAATMEAAVPPAVRRERLEAVLDLQRTISLASNEARIGRVTPVLVEAAADGSAVGRAPWQAPEVDGVVHVDRVRSAVRPGALLEVEITGADEHDLAARAL